MRPTWLYPIALALLTALSCQSAPNALAEPDTDVELVRDRVAAFFKAVEKRDIARMQALWDTNANVSMLTMRQHKLAVGWPAVRKAFLQGAFTYWNGLHAEPHDPPLVVFTGDAANALFLVAATGQTRSGQPVDYWIHVSQIFVRHGDQWAMIGCYATGEPE